MKINKLRKVHTSMYSVEDGRLALPREVGFSDHDHISFCIILYKLNGRFSIAIGKSGVADGRRVSNPCTPQS
jgi:hypothetical protein